MSKIRRTQRNLVGFLIYAAISTVLVILLASFSISTASAGQENFGPTDNGKIVELKPGTIITVKLPENPSTGYYWNYRVDSNTAEIIDDCFIPPDNSALGSGGTRLLKLKIIGSGGLNMSYERPWEKQPIDSFVLLFRI